MSEPTLGGAGTVPCVCDIGLLLVSNPNPVDSDCLQQEAEQQEQYLQAVARQNAQQLVQELWRLPTERAEDSVVALLPRRQTVLPREKPAPKPRPPTRWEEFARLKGIQRRKKERMAWHEASGEWRPRWGYGRPDDAAKSWLLEVPANADPMQDQFEAARSAKRERVAKNELQRLKNISRRLRPGAKAAPGVGVLPTTPAADAKDIRRALVTARTADASLGQFSQKVSDERVRHLQGKKRSFLANTGSLKAERQIQDQVLKELASKTELLNADRAANRALQRQQQQQQDGGDSNDGGGGREQRKSGPLSKATQGGKSRKQNSRDTKSRKYKRQPQQQQQQGKKAGGKKAGGKKAGGKLPARGKTLGKKK